MNGKFTSRALEKKIRVVTFELNTFKANSNEDKLHFVENHVEALNLGKTKLRP